MVIQCQHTDLFHLVVVANTSNEIQGKISMNNFSISYSAIALVASAMIFSACQPQEGPAERAGKQVDNAAESVGQHVEKAGQDLQDAAKGSKK